MTRDEFLDIMGGIDSELIDSAVNPSNSAEASDISRDKIIKLQNKRSYALRCIVKFSAYAAILAGAIALWNFIGAPTQTDYPSESTNSSYPAADLIRGWNPDKLVYSDTPVLGGNMRVSVAELDGITAELILHNIKKEAGTLLLDEPESKSSKGNAEGPEEVLKDYTEDFSIKPSYYDYDWNYTDYVGAEDIVLYIHDNEGRRFIETSITPHSCGGMELISSDCLFEDSTRLYKVEDYYILMQYADFGSNPSLPIARFYKVDLSGQGLCDENGIYSGGLTSIKVNGGLPIYWEYGCPVSKEFEYIGEGKFRDSVYNNVIIWDTVSGTIYYAGEPDYMSIFPESYYHLP